MPVISKFYGLIVRMYFLDTDRHPAPHIHVQLSVQSAVIKIPDRASFLLVKDTAKNASPQLLEPVMSVEVACPEAYTGDVIGEFTGRRGLLEGIQTDGATQTIKARVPLSEMFGYASDLRAMTQGRAACSMQFAQYEPAPVSVANESMEKAGSTVLEGEIESSKLKLAQAWIAIHHEELMADWRLALEGQPVFKIEPLR